MTLFFAGLIVLWWTNHAEVPTTLEAEAGQRLVFPGLAKTSASDFSKIVIEQPGEMEGDEPTPSRESRQLVFERRDGGWQMTQPFDVAADRLRLGMLLQNLITLTKTPEAGSIPESGERFGLKPPRAIVSLYRTGESTPAAALDFGKEYDQYLYVRTHDQPDIEVVDARIFQGIEDAPIAWRERSLIHLSSFQIAKINISGAKQNLKASRVRNQWRLTEPIRAIGDDTKIEGLLGGLTSLRVPDGEGGFVADQAADLARYGLDQAQAVRIELVPASDQEQPQVVLLGKPVPNQDGQYYAMQGGQDDVVVVRALGLSNLAFEPNSYRSSKILDFNPKLASYIRIHALGRSFELERTTKQWHLVKPTQSVADDPLVSALLSKLGALETSEFLTKTDPEETGLDSPLMTVELWETPTLNDLPAQPRGKPTGKSATQLNLGKRHVLSKSLYVRVPGDPTVLLVSDTLLQAFPENELAFQQHDLVHDQPAQIQRLTVLRDGKTFSVVPARSGAPNQWRMVEPVEAPANTEAVTKALLILSDLRAKRLLTKASGDLKPFGLDTPSLVIRWSTSTDPAVQPERVLEVGGRVQGAEAWYARLPSRSLIFTIGDDVVLPFREEFRSRSMLSFSPRKMKALTLKWPDRSLSFEHHATPLGGPRDWNVAAGSKAEGFDLSRIHSLANDLSKLSTRQILQYEGPIPEAFGLSKPSLTVEYQLEGDSKTHVLHVGARYEADEFYATTDSPEAGLVFALGGSGWAELVRPKEDEAKPKESSETNALPEDVFAPDPAAAEKK